jgi:hypothetical protein
MANDPRTANGSRDPLLRFFFAVLIGWRLFGHEGTRNRVRDKGRMASRKRPPSHDTLIRPYACQIGRVLWEWNQLHTSLFRLFWALVGDVGKPPRSFATDLWLSVRSDDQQRRILSVFAEYKLPKNSHILKKIEWVMKSINAIADYRNIATHVSMEITEITTGQPFITPSIDGVRKPAALKHVLTRFWEPGFWETLAADLYVLSQYVDVIGLGVVWSAPPKTFPYRPRLLSLQTILRANRQIQEWNQRRDHARQRKTTRQKRRPKSSSG